MNLASPTKRLACIALSLASVVGCAPKIYVIDRQTILEEEAAGEWPQFEKDLITKSRAEGPTPFSKVPVNASRARLYNVLNGELVSEAPAPAKAASPGTTK